MAVQTWDMVCDDMFGLMDTLSIDQAYLGGCSFGAGDLPKLKPRQDLHLQGGGGWLGCRQSIRRLLLAARFGSGA